MPNSAALEEIISCDSDFRIARDGTWYYHGSPIGRQAMVRLFSTILKRGDEGDYWLVTPVEKCRIEVEDVPFIMIGFRAREMDHGMTLCFKTNVNEWVGVDSEHPLVMRADPASGEMVPYVMVREGLEAKLSRPVYYELMEYLLEKGESREGVRGLLSAGEFFPLETKA